MVFVREMQLKMDVWFLKEEDKKEERNLQFLTSVEDFTSCRSLDFFLP